MATPPRITEIERDAAVERIAARHRRIDDPRSSALGTEPRDVISFVLDRGPAGVPRWVAALDHHDALVLSTWCWWEERRRERRLLRQGLHLGLTAGELGAPLGMSSRQGLRDRLDRLDALLSHDRPDEQLSRDARRAGRERDARQHWIDVHRAHVRSVLAGLIAQTRRFLEAPAGGDGLGGEDEQAADESAREWLDELAHDYADAAITPATLAVAGLLAAELRAHPRVLGLAPRHRVHAALASVEALRTRFSSAIAGPAMERDDDGSAGRDDPVPSTTAY